MPLCRGIPTCLRIAGSALQLVELFRSEPQQVVAIEHLSDLRLRRAQLPGFALLPASLDSPRRLDGGRFLGEQRSHLSPGQTADLHFAQRFAQVTDLSWLHLGGDH